MLILSMLLLMLAPLASAQSSVYARTQLNFNVVSTLAIYLQLPGTSNFTMTTSSPGVDTTNVEFNTTSSSLANVEAKVVGGTVQSTGVPIFTFYNVGTTNTNITVNLNATMPGCMTLKGGATYGAISTTLGTGQTTIGTNVAPGASQAYYLQTTFASCTTADTTTRYIYSNASN